MTAAQGDMVEEGLLRKLYGQMAQLNKAARDIMVRYDVGGCTDVTGFGFLGHAFEMARGSGLTLHVMAGSVPYYSEACEMADMGFIPAGAYRNRAYTDGQVIVRGDIDRAMMDVLYDPQTSGGLLIAVSERDCMALLQELQSAIPCAEIVGYAAQREDGALIIE